MTNAAITKGHFCQIQSPDIQKEGRGRGDQSAGTRQALNTTGSTAGFASCKLEDDMILF